MGLISFIAVYTVIWAVVFQAVLPFGVKSQTETGDIVKGTDPSAPVRLHWKPKILATTLIALAIWGILYWIYEGTGFGTR